MQARFVVFCLLLSAAIAGVTALLIFVPQKAFFRELLDVSYIMFLSILYLLSLFCVVFWKLLLPLVLIAYIAISAFTGVSLYALFGLQKDSFEIAVQPDGIYVDGTLEVAGVADSLPVMLYTLPPQLLLPVPRVWYRLGIQDTQEFTAAVYQQAQNTFFSQYVARYVHWCLSRSAVARVPLDQETSLPALYTCTLIRSWEQIRFSLQRTL